MCLNQCRGGYSRTIKAQYHKTSVANFIHIGAFGASGVIEIIKNTKYGKFEQRQGKARDKRLAAE